MRVKIIRIKVLNECPACNSENTIEGPLCGSVQCVICCTMWDTLAALQHDLSNGIRKDNMIDVMDQAKVDREAEEAVKKF